MSEFGIRVVSMVGVFNKGVTVGVWVGSRVGVGVAGRSSLVGVWVVGMVTGTGSAMTSMFLDSGVGVIYTPQSDGIGLHALRVSSKATRRTKTRFKIRLRPVDYTRGD